MLVVVGPKELEGSGRECDSPRKRPVLRFVGMVDPHVFAWQEVDRGLMHLGIVLGEDGSSKRGAFVTA